MTRQDQAVTVTSMRLPLYGATARLVDAANKSLPKENARIVKQVLGGLAGLTSAACVVSAYIAAEKARKEKNVLNKVLTGAAAAGTAAAALEIAVQSYDLFMNREQQSEPELGKDNIAYPPYKNYNE